ncbi:MAG: helix-turn-helix transcriptional regulator [Shimia sp.]|nr:helix-turn-helix transcriptional regulator [Shimia sp.]MCP4824815.1 helix-turn-helix transcriptional regulator [Shimia sp.]
MNRRWVLIGLFVLQGLCALFFVSEVVLTVVGARTAPISWHLREMMELGAVVGLLLGGVLGAVALNQAVRARRHAEASLRGVQLAFRDHMEAKFVQWGLSPAERDVALFTIKGMSIQEISGLRNTSEGTVKAQSNAIYRKSDVSGRTQLLSLFLDDLLAEDAED